VGAFRRSRSTPQELVLLPSSPLRIRLFQHILAPNTAQFFWSSDFSCGCSLGHISNIFDSKNSNKINITGDSVFTKFLSTDNLRGFWQGVNTCLNYGAGFFVLQMNFIELQQNRDCITCFAVELRLHCNVSFNIAVSLS
jgi:hypothetical protein